MRHLLVEILHLIVGNDVDEAAGSEQCPSFKALPLRFLSYESQDIGGAVLRQVEGRMASNCRSKKKLRRSHIALANRYPSSFLHTIAFWTRLIMTMNHIGSKGAAVPNPTMPQDLERWVYQWTLQ